MKRNRMLNRIAKTGKQWDVVVIGGGATGLGVALEACSRGYQTVLLEQHDFSTPWNRAGDGPDGLR